MRRRGVGLLLSCERINIQYSMVRQSATGGLKYQAEGSLRQVFFLARDYFLSIVVVIVVLADKSVERVRRSIRKNTVST